MFVFASKLLDRSGTLLDRHPSTVRRRLALAATLGLLAASAGCGSDSVVGDPILGQDSAGANGNDAAVTGDDSTAVLDVSIVGQDGVTPTPYASIFDTTTPAPDAVGPGQDAKPQPDAILVGPDLPPSEQCPGDCGEYVKGASCQCDEQCAQYNDCCGAYQSTCGSVGPGPGGSLVECAQSNCPSEVKACQGSKSCTAFLDCAANCTDQQCLLGCGQNVGGQTLQQLVYPLYQCAQGAGCLDGGTTDPGTTGPVCGDGTCEQPENTLNCDKDCDNPPGAAQQCIYDKCNSQYTACFANQSCIAALACFNETGSFQQCASQDPQGGQLLGAFLQCGQQQGCMGGQPQPTGPTCGDGKCESPENKLNCSKDCTTEPSATQQCIYDKCNSQYTACFGDDACLKAVACYNQQQSVQQCSGGSQSTAQKLQSMLQCGQQQGCFNGTQPAGSCAGKCGQFQAGASCQCTTQCKQFGNCCSDYAAQCETTTTKCGDGICASATENATNCPADCGGTPVVSCTSKADCQSSEICCGKADGSQVCELPANCK